MIVEWVYKIKMRLRAFIIMQSLRPSAPLWLFFVSVIESSIFPIPPDVMLITMVVSGYERPYRLAGLTTAGSVLGGVIGYIIGTVFFETIGVRLVELYGLADEVVRVAGYFEQNAFTAIFLSAFTPIPYKVFTLGAGLFSISFLQFMLASVLGRGSRFYLEVFFLKRYGHGLGRIFFRYFNGISFILAILILIWVFMR